MRVIESNLAPQPESGTKPRRETGRAASDEAIGKVETCAVHVATMSRGAAAVQWKSLGIKGSMLQF
jgi:hypothetical protein